MNSLVLSLITSIFFLAPSLVVQRTNQDDIIVAINGTNETLEKCMNGGVEVRYQFELELCRVRSGWFDSCKGKRSEKNKALFDPVSESFRIESDRLDDGAPPELKTVEDSSSAFSAVNTIKPMSLSFLAHGDTEFLGEKELYVRIRGLAYCKEERNETLEAITKMLTTGVTQLLQFDSGWESFAL